MDIEKIKRIYDEIEDVNETIADSTFKSLAAIAFYELEEQNGETLPYNKIIKFAGTDSMTTMRKIYMVQEFKKLDFVLEHYKTDNGYKNVADYFKSIVHDYKHIVKYTCEKLGITQKELAERLGIHLTTVQKWASSNDLPNNAAKSIGLLLENEDLKAKLNKFKTAFNMIDEARG